MEIGAGLAAVLAFALNMVKILVIASVIVSWVGDRSNQIVQTIYSITEPIFRPIRRYTERLNIPLDISPIVVFAIIIFIETAILPAISNL
ncbi:MAG: YggT family protein [Zetaproteobacteria bacterium]|nr:YggT family protein [Pseudobdellovibrionaceae bacterium]|tara:strand:- start:438 stop:707 length:270 start_codon:yes stop_codon:yes gene_type:complete